MELEKSIKDTLESPFPLYNQQIYALNFMHSKMKRGIYYAGLFMEMGTGKTKVMITWVDYLFKTKKVDYLLVWCPLSVINSWMDEIKKHAPHLEMYLDVAVGTKAQKLAAFNQRTYDFKILITNYESMLSLFKLNTFKSLNTEVRQSPNITILDESTRIKNYAAKTTKTMQVFSKFTQYKYILTGKPITRNPFDIYTQLRFLDSRIFKKSYTAFKKRYAVTLWNGTYEQVLEWRNLDELKNIISDNAVVLDKQSMDIKLPEKVYIDKRNPMPDEQFEAYKLAVKENLIWIKEQKDKVIISNLLTKLIKLQQISSGFIYYMDSTNRKIVQFKHAAKLLMLRDIMEDLADDEQVIIWCLFTHEMKMIATLMSDLKICSSTLMGEMSSEIRDASIKSFKNGEARVLIAQVASGCYGLNLMNARYAIYYTNTFNYEQRIQSEDRIHRIGQDKTCYYINLISADSVDELVLLNHKLKKQLIDESIPESRQADELIDSTIEHFKEWEF